VRRPAAASLTAAAATALMILRPTHSRVFMPAAITGRDSTARYGAMRGPTAAWRAMAQGGPHQEAMALSLSSRGTPGVKLRHQTKSASCLLIPDTVEELKN
jgi:hypothetical protein